MPSQVSQSPWGPSQTQSDLPDRRPTVAAVGFRHIGGVAQLHGSGLEAPHHIRRNIEFRTSAWLLCAGDLVRGGLSQHRRAVRKIELLSMNACFQYLRLAVPNSESVFWFRGCHLAYSSN